MSRALEEELELLSSPPAPQPIPLEGSARTPWERERRLGHHPLEPPSPTPRQPHPRSSVTPAAATAAGTATGTSPANPTTSQQVGPRVRSAAQMEQLIPASREAKTPPQLRRTPSRGRYVIPVGSPRVETGLVSQQRPTQITARERVLLEEEELRSRRRSMSPAFRSNASRFGLPHDRPNASEQYDRLSYLRPSFTANLDYYVPPGIAERSVRATSPAKVVFRSNTPRFLACIPHGSGMVCPVLETQLSPRRRN